ncbi:MAG: hypothetical protein J0G32_08560, partial [Alphaproteobacteria bacterium]|nr:hypothetical protein [Alphaproteobacteria bacterium]
FVKLYKVMEFVSEVVERRSIKPAQIAQKTYNLMAIFDKDPEKALNYLNNFISKNSGYHDYPVDKILNFELPPKNMIHLSAWKKLLKDHGDVVIQMLSKAVQYENLLDTNNSRGPKDISELNLIRVKVEFERYKENPKLAELYFFHNAKSGQYNQTLDLIANGSIKFKNKDNLPIVTLDVGSEIRSQVSKDIYQRFRNLSEQKVGLDNKKITAEQRAENIEKITKKEVDNYIDNLYMVKLPAGDYRGLILGDISKCCQTIGRNGEQCAIDGTNLENNGFYVLIKANAQTSFNPAKIDWDNFEKNGHNIIGQGYAWRSTNNNIVFDSWENASPEIDNDATPSILKAFSEKLIDADPTISKVIIGLGGRTPLQVQSAATPNRIPDTIIEGVQYKDSKSQMCIAKNKKIIEFQEKLKKSNPYLTDEFINSITSLKQVAELEQIVKSDNSEIILKQLDNTMVCNLMHHNFSIEEIKDIYVLNSPEISNAIIKCLASESSDILHSHHIFKDSLMDLEFPKLQLIASVDGLNFLEVSQKHSLNFTEIYEKIKTIDVENLEAIFKAGDPSKLLEFKADEQKLDTTITKLDKSLNEFGTASLKSWQAKVKVESREKSVIPINNKGYIKSNERQ